MNNELEGPNHSIQNLFDGMISVMFRGTIEEAHDMLNYLKARREGPKQAAEKNKTRKRKL